MKGPFPSFFFLEGNFSFWGREGKIFKQELGDGVGWDIPSLFLLVNLGIRKGKRSEVQSAYIMKLMFAHLVR